jgi:hypothetical protein
MLVNRDTGEVIAKSVFVAKTFWPRFKGLQFTKTIPPDFAYIITGCGSIHTCFMRFKLDAVFVDENWTVLKVHSGLKPFRVTNPVKDARAVIELKHRNLCIEPGHVLELIE